MSNVKVRVPNAEQMVAIEHLGGKILSAGAGSGKTFVIIEHIIFKLQEFRKSTPAQDWANQIPFYLPKIVLMTFTNKAAGEMSIRLMNKIDDLCLEDEDGNVDSFWILVRQYLTRMNVTTISSFCKQIIGQGLVPDIATDVEILSAVEYKNKITNLYSHWYNQNAHTLDQVFKANSNAIISGMIEIFGSPELRLMWREELEKSTPETEINSYLDYLKKKLKLEVIFEEAIDLSTSDTKGKPKTWFIFLEGFNNLIVNHGELSASNFQEYISFFDNSKNVRASKDMTEIQVKQYHLVKKLNQALSDSIARDFSNLIEHYDVYWKWAKTLKDVFEYISDNYFKEPGFNFADLEYFVCLGLRNPDVRPKIVENYNYLIVDEFQDTSSVQYEIIKHLLDGNNKKLFCVGDIKQAIYGFRGGEITVFKECVSMLGAANNLKLENNFRSSGNVIDYNNKFFNIVFPLGHGFEDEDPLTVKMEEQKIPTGKEETGKIQRINGIVQGVNSKEIRPDQAEAQILYEHIKDLLKEDSIHEVCVLYKVLSPSSYLLEMLIEDDQTFKAQVKVQFNEDPIINLFLRTIEIKLNQNNEKKLASTHFLIQNLLKVLESDSGFADHEDKFLKNIDILGLKIAFQQLVYSLGISNSLYGTNNFLIDSICKVCKDDPLRVYQLISNESSEKYSLDLINGQGSKKIILMSAHASKGLEFDAVCLAGLYTNGRAQGMDANIGKIPKSLKWKKAYNQKKFFKSPMYYYESDFDKDKDFSESKRLLYVACTRAVSHLAWVKLFCESEKGVEELTLASSKSSHWIKAFQKIDEQLLEENSKTISIEQKNSITNNLALILKDSLGIVNNDDQLKLGLFAETSVTKLTHLAQCPFKFYLSNICKIEPQTDIKKIILDQEEGEELEEKFYSSKERGVKVHKYLSDILKGDLTVDDVPASEREKISWTIEKAKDLGNHIIVSEKMIKFSLFGQMISGTPDIVFHNDDELVIWDFKTGLRHAEDEDGYWFQLFAYGHAYGKLKQFSPEKMITLALIYLDDQEVVTQKLSMQQIDENLFGKWSKTECLNQPNKEHCRRCEYANICHYSGTSTL